MTIKQFENLIDSKLGYFLREVFLGHIEGNPKGNVTRALGTIDGVQVEWDADGKCSKDNKPFPQGDLEVSVKNIYYNPEIDD